MKDTAPPTGTPLPGPPLPVSGSSRLPSPSLDESTIRRALHAKCLRNPRLNPDTIVIEELGLAHARCRIDIAVIDRCIHGYEIKSSLDTLLRLPQQLRYYSMTLQKMTLVVGTKHLRPLLTMLPSWAGLLQVQTGPRGGISFDRVQPSRANPNFDPFMFLHLLWRREAEEALRALGESPGSGRSTRKELYGQLVQALSTAELIQLIKRVMKHRANWRALPPLE